MQRNVAIADERADPDALGIGVDRAEWKARNVDERGWRRHAALHQIDDIGAAGDECRVLRLRDQVKRFARISGLKKLKRLHAAPLAVRPRGYSSTRRNGTDCRSSLRGSRRRYARAPRSIDRAPKRFALRCRNRTGTRRAR